MVRYCPKAIPDHKPSLGMGRMPGGRSEEKSVRAQTRIRLRPSGCVPAGNGRSDYNKYCCNRDCNEPPHPVNSSAAIAAEGRIDEPTDENTADPTKDGEPKGSVVSAAWCDELAQQPDDDPCDDHSDYFQGISSSCELARATPRPAFVTARHLPAALPAKLCQVKSVSDRRTTNGGISGRSGEKPRAMT